MCLVQLFNPLTLWYGWQDNEAAGSSGNNEEAQPSLQSPWELFDADLDPQQAAQEGPQLDPVTAGRLTRAVDILMAWEQFEVFVDLLDPDAAYPTDSGEAVTVHMIHLLLLPSTM